MNLQIYLRREEMPLLGASNSHLITNGYEPSVDFNDISCCRGTCLILSDVRPDQRGGKEDEPTTTCAYATPFQYLHMTSTRPSRIVCIHSIRFGRKQGLLPPTGSVAVLSSAKSSFVWLRDPGKKLHNCLKSGCIYHTVTCAGSDCCLHSR